MLRLSVDEFLRASRIADYYMYLKLSVCTYVNMHPKRMCPNISILPFIVHCQKYQLSLKICQVNESLQKLNM